MNAQQNAPISDRFSSLCARVFSPAAAILESEKTLGTRLERKLNKNKCEFRLCCFSRLDYLVLVKETVSLYQKKSTMHVFIASNHWIVQ